MVENRWIADIAGELSETEARQLMELWTQVNSVRRDQFQEDVFSWPWSASGVYTARSTYKMLCLGQEQYAAAACIWSCRGPLKLKIFIWLALKHRLWTTDRRARHGLQLQADACHLCLQEVDAIEHILVQCVYARQVWHYCRQAMKMAIRIPSPEQTLEAWWLEERALVMSKKKKKWLDAWIILVCWHLWKQRNARVFGDIAKQCNEDVLAARIVEDMKMWSKAGVGDLDVET